MAVSFEGLSLNRDATFMPRWYQIPDEAFLEAHPEAAALLAQDAAVWGRQDRILRLNADLTEAYLADHPDQESLAPSVILALADQAKALVDA